MANNFTTTTASSAAADVTMLEAVNRLLSLCGWPPVAALDTGGASLQGQAESLINQEKLSVHREEWHHNVRRQVEYTPDGSNEISLAALTDLIAVDAEDTETLDVTLVGGKLYDLTNNRATFTSPIKLRLTSNPTWSNTPGTLQELIIARAAIHLLRRHQRSMYQDRGAFRDTESRVLAEITRTNAVAQADNSRRADVNRLDDANGIRVRGGRSRTPFYRFS